MKFLIAPDKFKGSMDALTAAKVMQTAILEKFPTAETVCLPLADGGEGSLQVFQQIKQFEEIIETVQDPLGRPISASYLFDSKKETAIIEMAQASGYLRLTPEERNPMYTSTYGMGEQIKSAIERGARNILLCIGGSATTDCGIGMAAALGYQFLDKNGKSLHPTGENMIQIQQIKTDNVLPELKDVKVEVACDVNNPLYGHNGAAHVYGPQKGASAQEVDFLDKGLQHLSKIIECDLGKDISSVPGGGAAGGIGAGAVAFLDASLLPGAKLILDTISFNEHLASSDWVFTGEGKIDKTSFQGKLLSEIVNRNSGKDIPISAFAGRIENVNISLSNQIYLNEISPRNIDIEEALKKGQEFLGNCVREFLNQL